MVVTQRRFNIGPRYVRGRLIHQNIHQDSDDSMLPVIGEYASQLGIHANVGRPSAVCPASRLVLGRDQRRLTNSK